MLSFRKPRFLIINAHAFLEYSPLLLLIGIFAFLLTIVIHNDFFGNDAYFHYQYSKGMNFFSKNALPWMYFSIHRENFIDLEWLYHLLLAVFVKPFGVWGAKLFIFFNLLGILIGFYSCLYELKFEQKIWPILFLLCASVHFTTRILMLRPHAMTIILLLLFCRSIVSRQYKCQLLFSFIYTIAHSSYIILPILALIWFLLERRKYFNSLYAVSLGIGIGFCFQSNPVDYIQYSFQSIIYRCFIQEQMIMGQEWLPFGPRQFLSGNFALAGLILFIIFCFYRNMPPVGKTTKFYFWTHLLFFIFMTKSGRFIEFYVPFLLIFFSYHLKELKEIYNCNFIPSITSKHLLINISAFCFVIIQSFGIAKNSEHTIIPISRLIDVNHFIKNNYEKNSIIYNVSWSDFTQLFYINPNNYYVTGLDPHFLYEYNKEMFTTYSMISRGYAMDRLDQIPILFQTKIILASKSINYYKGSIDFIKNVSFNKQLKKLYEDSYFIVYEIRS